MQYNYVYLNSSYLRHGKIDRNEYNAICLRDVEQLDNVQVVQCPLEYSSVFIRRLYNMSAIIDKKYHTQIQRLWYPFIVRNKFENDSKPLCFVVSSYELPLSFFSYLRKKYPNCKIVKLYRDLVRVITASNSDYSIDNAKKTFDLCLTYDYQEAREYGIGYFPEIESKVKVEIDRRYPLCDVFFAGEAKDRYDKIICAYEKLTAAGLDCDFYLTRVPLEKRIPRKGITYADCNMPFLDMLYKSVNCRCMLDIYQGGAVGYTSRFIEAVMYNKKLIADNLFIKESNYYNPRFMQIVESVEKIEPSFVLEDIDIDYDYQGDFSPVKLIRQIDNELSHIKESEND